MTDDNQQMKPAEAEYEIGYGKPPEQHQFKKGAKSPNPKGRPKGAKGLKTIVCAAAEAPAEYVMGGKITKGTRLEVAMQQLSLKAMKGDLKAIEKLAVWYAQYGPPSEIDTTALDVEADEQTLQYLLRTAAQFSKNPQT